MPLICRLTKSKSPKICLSFVSRVTRLLQHYQLSPTLICVDYGQPEASRRQTTTDKVCLLSASSIKGWLEVGCKVVLHLASICATCCLPLACCPCCLLRKPLPWLLIWHTAHVQQVGDHVSATRPLLKRHSSHDQCKTQLRSGLLGTVLMPSTQKLNCFS